MADKLVMIGLNELKTLHVSCRRCGGGVLMPIGQLNTPSHSINCPRCQAALRPSRKGNDDDAIDELMRALARLQQAEKGAFSFVLSE
jgi:hypothetical protein